MSAILSLLGLTTRGDAEEFAVQQRTWAGVFDLDRTRAGWVAYCLTETREPITARTPAALGDAMAAARSAGKVRQPDRVSPW